MYVLRYKYGVSYGTNIFTYLFSPHAFAILVKSAYLRMYLLHVNLLVLRGSTGNFNSNFTTNALATLPYYVAKQLTQLFLMNIITRALRAQAQHTLLQYSLPSFLQDLSVHHKSHNDQGVFDFSGDVPFARCLCQAHHLHLHSIQILHALHNLHFLG